jgi:hypothetical protein
MNKVRRVSSSFEDPQFPQWKMAQSPVGFLVGALLWIVMLLGFLFLFYVQLFSFYTRYLLRLVKANLNHVPFWFSVLIVVFIFPLSLAVILIGALVKLLNN